MSSGKKYDEMSKEEQDEHDNGERARERSEQAGTLSAHQAEVLMLADEKRCLTAGLRIWGQ